ncbi:MAG: hypothetical protein JW839_00745 [Candidatus Lokiarchaeota archaeon]|nr:hypothetical protein [Candidatus Lokiarchaeota archaeon]
MTSLSICMGEAAGCLARSDGIAALNPAQSARGARELAQARATLNR